MSPRRPVSIFALLVATAVIGGGSTARAGFPGANGKIVFVATRADGAPELFTMNGDGSAQTRLTTNDPSAAYPAWSPDGRRVAFLVPTAEGDASEVWTMRRDGTDRRRIAGGAVPVDNVAWSPSGARLAFTCGGWRRSAICLVGSDGSGLARLTALRPRVRDRGPSWSPDGTRIVFERSSRSGLPDLYVVGVRSHALGRLTTTPGSSETSPAWAHRTGKIAYLREPAASYDADVYVMGANGSGARNLTRSVKTSVYSAPDWSPAGDRLVTSGADQRLLVIRADGGGVRATRVKGPYEVQNPVWSPDGKEIALDDALGGLWLVGPAGAGPHVLLAGGADGSPAVSPDGRTIASARADGRILLLDFAGSRLGFLYGAHPAWSPDGAFLAVEAGEDQGISVTARRGDSWYELLPGMGDMGADDRATKHTPAWSPDGTRIAYVPMVNDSLYGIHTITVVGRKIVRLTDGADTDPDWSPDGRRIAFTRSNGIWAANADGTDPRKVADAGADPAWSPDGSRIAFVSTRDGNREIYVMNADGSGQTRLTFDPGPDADPDWQPLP